MPLKRRYLVMMLAAAAVGVGVSLPLRASAADTPSALESDPNGWKDLVAEAGPALKGWTRGPIPPTAKLKSATESQWSVDPKTGYLVCQGDGGHEWLRWDEEQADSIFHVEWRFTPIEGPNRYNSGIYTRNSADAAIWHQAQTGGGSGGYLFGETPVGGKLGRINLSKQLTEKRVKPAGEWNTFELTSRGKSITLWVNGAVTSVFDSCEVPRGYVGLEAEGYRIEFRNVRLKPLRP